MIYEILIILMKANCYMFYDKIVLSENAKEFQIFI